ncbi:Tricarboxylate transport protein [Nesidiocoris tenuis]|uniref:Citrate transport protein n=1 Tax=Nesidiocoris tenuis TaxID=355587 RepID=A0ABN7A877_9HEMI|nr:Tricarboxylate transport protein [Nesidiocoris tenuis]
MDDYRGNPFIRPWMTQPGGELGYSQSNILLKALLTGGITGAVELFLSYPMEYIKTQLQFEQKSVMETLVTNDTTWKTIRYTYKQSGILGFYKGMGILLIGNVPKAAARFGTFEWFRQRFGDEDGSLRMSGKLCGGILAGVVESVVAVTPIETIKVKVIHDMNRPKPRYKGSFHTIVRVLREEGVRGTYQGLLPTTLKQATNQGSRFLLMESFKEFYDKENPSKPLPPHIACSWGIVTSFFTTYLNSPIDLVKTRMQGLERKRYKSSWDCLRRVFVDEGFLALYRGANTRSLRMSVDTIVSFALYDHVMNYLSIILP